MVSYEMLCQKHPEIVAKWSARSFTEGGQLRSNIYFGELMSQPMVAGRCVVWFGKGARWDGKSKVDKWARSIAESSFNLMPEVRLYARAPGVHAKLMKSYSAITLEDEYQALEFLATAEVVVSVGILPNAYVKRASQRHIHVVTASECMFDRLQRASFGISCMLSADCIVTPGRKTQDKITDLYQLDQVYRGEFLFAKGSLIDVLKTNACYSAGKMLNTDLHDKSKRRVLIYHDATKSTDYTRYLKHVTRLIDFERYDITLFLSGKSYNRTDNYLIEEVDPRVRIIIRRGSFVCDKDSFVRLHVVNESVRLHEDEPDVISLLPLDVYANEIDRLIYGVSFDAALYFASPKRSDFFYIGVVPTARRVAVRLDIESLYVLEEGDEQRLISLRNVLKLQDLIFDAVICANTELAELHTAHFRHCTCKTWNLPFPVEFEKRGEALPEIVFEEKTYLILEDHKNGALHEAVLVLKPNQDKQNYVLFAKACDVAYCVDAFMNARSSSEHLFVFVENKGLEIASKILPSIPEEIQLIDADCFEGIDDLSAYFSYFTGYLKCGLADSSALRFTCESMGMPVFRIEPEGICGTEEMIQNAEDYSGLCDNALLELFHLKSR